MKKLRKVTIPIIDIFAGPGGLGEGFSAFQSYNTNHNRDFRIVLSIEKEYYAHRTLTLRSFFRQFRNGNIPNEYYEFIRGEITREELFNLYPIEAEKAKSEAWQAELGDGESSVLDSTVDEKISKALAGEKNWLLIGGPPCQAYSVVGRVRRKEKMLDEKKDERVGLYKQYLRILAVHNPSIFVMENVKGLLSAKTKSSQVFSNILKDLSDPVEAYTSEKGTNGVPLNCPGYKIFSLVAKPKEFDSSGNPTYNHRDFLICSEDYGIPQTRHRVILLGIRKDFDIHSGTLSKEDEIPISKVLSGLPRLRSGLSKIENNGENWKMAIKDINDEKILKEVEQKVRREIQRQLKRIRIPKKGTGAEFISKDKIDIEYKPDWFLDEKIGGVCNHSSRGHMESDLHRYFFVSCFGKVMKKSANLNDFPNALLPDHKNVKSDNNNKNNKKFTDRFRVQLWNMPSKTITSHISKDGHYYIHPDSSQCRSFTVREAARIQTFPDNYFFCGPRTSQFTQVGNAVPPLLANKIAVLVNDIFKSIQNDGIASKKKAVAII